MEALSEEGRKKDVLMILTTFDILKVSSQKNMEILFKSLGMLQLESHVKSFILELQATDMSSHDLSNLIYIYATNIPMLQIQEIVERFISLQTELKVKSSAATFQKLIESCCDLREVLENKKIHSDDLNEIKSMLVFELATKGHMSDALAIYDEMTQDRQNLEPKAVLALIQHGQDRGELHRLLELLNQLEDYDLWVSGCDKIMSLCVRHKLLSSTVDLLKQRMQKATNYFQIKDIFVGAIAEVANMEPADIQFGINLLRAMKEDLRIEPPRRCLDDLLAASVDAKEGAELVWKEYELAGLPYNLLTYLWMHKALLASGQHEQAELLLENIPRDILGSYSLVERRCVEPSRS